MNKARSAAFPYILWSVLFTVLPLLLVAYFAFTNGSGTFTLDNFANLGEYTAVFVRSLLLALISTLLCFMIGYPLAYILSRESARRQQIMIMLVMLPMWMNFLLRTYAWLTILENNGLINRLLEFLGFAPLHMINTQGAVVLGMVYNYLPYMILPIYTVLIKLDYRLIEAAHDLGANPAKTFFRVVVPLSMPGVSSGITMVFMPAVSTFIISKMLGGGSSLMVGDLIEMQFLGNAYDPNLGAAISLVMMVIILISMLLMGFFDSEDKAVIM
ncbi:MAG: ABC transporter permease [Clostridia bacterium]|nr:ABC transporter permease [Clostridia bacterium]MDR3645474.1 ABC transporter permease [Clostridia bacterium]